MRNDLHDDDYENGLYFPKFDPDDLEVWHWMNKLPTMTGEQVKELLEELGLLP